MGIKRLQFATRADKNGNTYSVVIDVDSKQFARNNHWVSNDFIRIGKRDYDKLITQLAWFGFKEVN